MTAAGPGPAEPVRRCSQGCDVTDLLNRLEQRMNQLVDTWERVHNEIDTLTERLGH